VQTLAERDSAISLALSVAARDCLTSVRPLEARLEAMLMLLLKRLLLPKPSVL